MITKEKIDELSEKYNDYVIETRRHLHRHPEKALHEYETSAFVKAELGKMGIPWEAVGETGVIGRISGNGKSGRTVGLRADMDALELVEDTDVDFPSEVPGMMHGCGHDAHTAMLLGAARVLTELGQENIPGDILLIFQPAEELAAGAQMMIDSGKLGHVDAIYGQHIFANYPFGKVYTKPGAIMAGIEAFRISLKGTGGHGSEPELSNNPMMAAAAIISALYTIPVNDVSGQEKFIISVNKAQIGTRMNIIPETGVIEGNIRYRSFEACRIAHRRIGEIAHGIAAAFGLECVFEDTLHTDPLLNSEELFPFLEKAVNDTLGEGSIVTSPDIMGSEDFSAYAKAAPIVFALVGTNDPETGCIYMQHSPHYKINEKVLKTGVALHVRFALNFLGGSR